MHFLYVTGVLFIYTFVYCIILLNKLYVWNICRNLFHILYIDERTVFYPEFYFFVILYSESKVDHYSILLYMTDCLPHNVRVQPDDLNPTLA